MKDFLGTIIRPGVRLVYPVRRGSSMWLTKITVTNIEEVVGRLQGVNDTGRCVTISRSDRCVVVPLLCDYCGHNPY